MRKLQFAPYINSTPRTYGSHLNFLSFYHFCNYSLKFKNGQLNGKNRLHFKSLLFFPVNVITPHMHDLSLWRPWFMLVFVHHHIKLSHFCFRHLYQHIRMSESPFMYHSIPAQPQHPSNPSK
jgi:hypothetical protein